MTTRRCRSACSWCIRRRWCRQARQFTPPGYFGGEPAHADLGAGVDERATIPAVLRGSRVRLEIALNKPVPRPVAGREREWISGMVGEQFAALVHDARAGREGLPGTEL